MKPELLKHIEILKTVPEIKELIEELKFGCIISWLPNEWKEWRKYWIYWENDEYFNSRDEDYDEIIWQVHEWHLRMFLNTLWDNFIIKENWIINNVIVNSRSTSIIETTICKLNNTKWYMEQDEKFFKKLNEFLINEFNIKI